MQIILKKDVQNLGEAGDLITVKDGYARNFLLPYRYAELATEGALKNREKNLARIKSKQEKLHNEALDKAKKIEEFAKLELSAKAGESGKLFGTITTKKLTEELAAKSGIEVDRKNVSLDAPINKIGEYKMLIKLTSKVKTEIAVIVTASEVLQEKIEEEIEEEIEEMMDVPKVVLKEKTKKRIEEAKEAAEKIEEEITEEETSVEESQE